MKAITTEDIALVTTEVINVTNVNVRVAVKCPV